MRLWQWRFEYDSSDPGERLSLDPARIGKTVHTVHNCSGWAVGHSFRGEKRNKNTYTYLEPLEV